jgi:hypothetical protein
MGAINATASNPYGDDTALPDASVERIGCTSPPPDISADDQPKKETGSRLKAAVQAFFAESDEVVKATGAHLANLLDSADRRADGKQQFTDFLQSAFEFARERSQNRDPIVENRAAILASAVLLGHHRLATFVGPIDSKSRRDEMKQYSGRVTLRGRADWTKHFWVSAGLAVLANGVLSDVVGVMKEGIDSTSGSGFSFADLLADRAGTMFAMAATRDAAAARRMQDRLANGVRIDDIFPSARGLPEGISAAVLERDYGGIGGAGYRLMLKEIDRRLATCRGRQ